MASASLLSLQIGRPVERGVENAPDPMDRLWTSAFYKDPVDGPLWLTRTGLAGDAQADQENHGGLDKAVLGYATAHYPTWSAELHRPDTPYGAFGENFSIAGLTEETVCLGDIYTIGPVEVEVSQPRVPCWKMARRWRVQDMVARATKSGRTGWYFRVLQEGYVGAGLPIVLRDRPHPEWPITRVHQIYHFERDNRAAAAELAALPALADSWRKPLAKRAAAQEQAE